MSKERLDKVLFGRGLARSRSEAEDIIRRGFVEVNDTLVTKPGVLITPEAELKLHNKASFVSRAGEKLLSVLNKLELDFEGRTVLDVGSSTGGFSQLALSQGATRVIAVDVGHRQMHPSLRPNPRIELHEGVDIRDFKAQAKIDMALVDVSFISLREVLPAVKALIKNNGEIIAMVKPQFEAGSINLKHKGVIKNETIRRAILKDFENWLKPRFKIIAKADSDVAGAKGNLERFYKLRHLG